MRELRETRCARARPIPTDSVRACCYAVAGHGFTTGKGATHHIIHRGRHEIGGMCIEVAADDGMRILLDLGMPLQAPDGGDFPWGTPQRPTEELIAEGVLVDVSGVFPHDPAAPDADAIVFLLVEKIGYADLRMDSRIDPPHPCASPLVRVRCFGAHWQQRAPTTGEGGPWVPEGC